MGIGCGLAGLGFRPALPACHLWVHILKYQCSCSGEDGSEQEAIKEQDAMEAFSLDHCIIST